MRSLLPSRIGTHDLSHSGKRMAGPPLAHLAIGQGGWAERGPPTHFHKPDTASGCRVPLISVLHLTKAFPTPVICWRDALACPRTYRATMRFVEQVIAGGSCKISLIQ